MNQYSDGFYDTKLFIGKPVFSYPRPRESGAFVLRQRVSIDADDYTPAPVATNVGAIAHPVYSDALLVAEEAFDDIGNGVVHYTEVYANKPNDYTVPAGNVSYPFPGFLNQRAVTTLDVQVSRTHEFFVTVDPIADISTIAAFRPVADGTQHDVDILTDGGGVATLTDPTRANYKTNFIDTELLVVRESVVSRYLGNIWERVTDRVLAK